MALCVRPVLTHAAVPALATINALQCTVHPPSHAVQAASDLVSLAVGRYHPRCFPGSFPTPRVLPFRAIYRPL